MKKLIVSAMLVGLTSGAFAQGQINLDNLSNSGTSSTATTGGLFWQLTGASATLRQTDFNVEFYGGATSTSLSLLASFTGAGAAGGSFGNGQWADPTGAARVVPGTASGGSAFFQINAWTGTASSYANFLAAPGANIGAASSVFAQGGLGGGTVTPGDLTAMPAMVLTTIPEPSTFALAGLGAAALLIFRRRK